MRWVGQYFFKNLLKFMHIVLLNDDSLPKARGGAAVIVDHLRKGFANAGHAATLLTTHQDSDDETRTEDEFGSIISIPVKYDLSKRHRKCIRNPEVTERLDKLLMALKPDVVHAHNIHTYYTYQSLVIAKKYAQKVILTAHDTFLVSFDRVRGSGYEKSELGGRGYKMHWWNHLSSVGKKYWPLRNSAIRKILRESECRVVAISEATKKFLEANCIEVHSVMPNGIELPTPPSDEEIQNFRREKNLTGPTILFAGRIRGDKGIGVALEAFEKVLEKIPNAQFLAAGERERLTPYINDRIRDAVITTGWISPEKMQLAYAACDVVTTPSIYLDNFPTVNLEAMAAGKPVIGTCFGGTPEAVLDGETGTIINPENIDEFAEAILELLGDPEKRKRMGEAGRNRISDNFSLDEQVRRYLNLFDTSC